MRSLTGAVLQWTVSRGLLVCRWSRRMCLDSSSIILPSPTRLTGCRSVTLYLFHKESKSFTSQPTMFLASPSGIYPNWIVSNSHPRERNLARLTTHKESNRMNQTFHVQIFLTSLCSLRLTRPKLRRRSYDGSWPKQMNQTIISRNRTKSLLKSARLILNSTASTLCARRQSCKRLHR